MTGATGFVGGHLVPMLATSFPAATIITTDPGFDITQADSVNQLVKGLCPDACVHLAGIAAIGIAKADPDRAWQVNLHGTLLLARSILEHAPRCRLVFASSADIYGRSFLSGHALDESALPAPINVYGSTKAAADLALGAMAAEGLQVIRLRPFNHIGPGQQPGFAVPDFARQIVRIAAGHQAPVIKTGDLSPLRDFLDVRDVCAAYALCLKPELDFAPGTIFNIASGRTVRIGDLLDRLLRIACVTARVELADALQRRSDILVASGDARDARRQLGWSPMYSLDNTLGDVIADWRRKIGTE